MKSSQQSFEGGDPILRPLAAARYLGVSRPTLYRWLKLGVLPAPSRIGISAIGWRLSVLDSYIRSREGAEVPHAATA